MSTASSALEAKTGPGVVPLWTELKDGETKAMRWAFRLKQKTMRRGQDKDEPCHFCQKGLSKTCGEPWDGSVVKGQMR